MRHTCSILILAAACTDDATDDATNDAPGLPAFEDGQTWVPGSYGDAAPQRVIFFGDSITAGAGAQSSEPYVDLMIDNDSGSWPEFDDVDLETAFGEVEVIDVSVGGATTSSMRSNQLRDLRERVDFPLPGKTLVFFTIGGNDLQSALFPGADVDAIRQQALDNVDRMIDWMQADKRFEDVEIYATNVYEPTDGIGQTDACFLGISFEDKMEDLEGYNDDLRAMAEDKGFANIDLRGHFLGHGFYADNDTLPTYEQDDPTRWFADDCIHPNDRGHHEIRRLFMGALDQVSVVE